jgi:MFS family permease
MVKLDFTNPIVTIITGIIFILIVTYLFDSKIGPYGAFIIIVIGGFIATYFAKERKIRYGLYVGIISMAIAGISTIFMTNSTDIIISLLIGSLGIIIIGAVFGTIGGFLGKRIPKKETKPFESFNEDVA